MLAVVLDVQKADVHGALRVSRCCRRQYHAVKGLGFRVEALGFRVASLAASSRNLESALLRLYKPVIIEP